MSRAFPKTRAPTAWKVRRNSAYPPVIPYASLADVSSPSRALPPYGHAVADPLSGFRLRRITTDVAPFPLGRERYATAYSKVPCITGQYRYLSWYSAAIVLDKDTDAYIQVMPGSVTPANSYPSQITANRVYGVHAATADFQQATVVPAALTTIRTFAPTYNYISIGAGEGTPSNDERYWAFLLRKASDSTWDVVCYDKQTDTVLGTWSTGITFMLNSTSPRVESCAVSQTGTYVIVSVYGGTVNGLAQGVHVFDRTMAFQRTLSANVAHADCALEADGVTDVYVCADGFAIRKHRLSDGTVTALLPGTTSANSYASSFTHITARNILRPGYAYLSTFDGATVDANAKASPLFNVIYALRLSDGAVERFGYGQHTERSSGVYAQSPLAVPSADGTEVTFGSAGPASVSDADVAHCYVLKKP